MSHILVALPWSTFQPHGQAVSAHAMRQLERLLNECEGRGVDAMLLLLPFKIGRRLWLPEWAFTLHADTETHVAGTTLVKQPRSIFRDRVARSGQDRLLREVTGEFDAHPSVAGWVLGDRPPTVSEPSSRHEYEDWLQLVSSASRVKAVDGRVWHAISTQDLVLSETLPLHSFGELSIGAVIVDDWRPRWAVGDRWAPFLVAYGRSLLGVPTIVSSFWRADRVRPGQDVVERLLESVAASGGQGIIAPSLLDLPEAAFAPLAGSVADWRGEGLLNARRIPTKAGAVWSNVTFSRGRVCDDHALVDRDDERRRLDPEGFARTVFGEFQS